MINKALFSSEKMEWETPDELFNLLNKIFNFTLDVSANINNKKCEKFYNKEIDGLAQLWKVEAGGVWCNPPYGREIKNWTKKAYNESLKSDSPIVLLIPARTDTIYFHNDIYGKAKLFFIKGRLKFLNKDKQEQDAAPFPSMLVIYNYKGEDLTEINRD